MIQFFRKIRQNLLMENNTGKYFKYAIGEIILVVIGILIAVNVNNWNNDIIANKQAILYKKQLKKDLQLDSTYINSYLGYINESEKKWQSLKKRITDSQATLDTIIKIDKEEFNYFVRIFNGFNNNTFNTIGTSGKWDVFTDEFVYDITSFYNFQEKSYNLINQEIQSNFLNNLYSHGKAYPHEQPFAMLGKGPANAFLWENLDKQSYLVSFNGVTTTQATYFRLTKQQLLILKRRIHQILDTHFSENK